MNALKMLKRRRIRPEDYTIGWVCALPIELAAVQELLDEKHEKSYRNAGDTNIYTLGRIGEHNVVVACLPYSQIGTDSAASVATQMQSAFPSIQFGLMVGIGGGLPTPHDIRLGDVVVSRPGSSHGGVVQYDFGKATNSGFKRSGFLNAPPVLLLNAVARLEATYSRKQIGFLKYVSQLNKLEKFARETAGPDLLYDTNYHHVSGDSCQMCDRTRLVERKPRDQEIMVHYGAIASGNQVMRDAIERDRVSSELGGVLCFEMEAAGLMNTFPCLVIRGICDYADSHKNKMWQAYAAGTSAAYAKEVLSIIPSANLHRQGIIDGEFS
jgi:nucleoside phosphorylase